MSATELTPLEELQAAHKRLSELSGPVDVGHEYRNRWRITDEIDGMCEVGMSHGEVISTWQENGPDSDLPVTRATADLIVTLHRTIDAQLTLLADRSLDDVSYQVQGDSPALLKVRTVDPAVLSLARAINGSDYA